MKQFKQVPEFKSEKEEREFWQNHSSADYLDWSKAQRGVLFPNLKLTTKPITIRLPAGLIDRVKIKAHKMDIPYQSLIKKMIFDSMEAK